MLFRSVVQPFENFSREPNGRKIGKVGAWCKQCCVLKNKTVYKQRVRNSTLKKYNLTHDSYIELLQQQDCVCKICGIPADKAPGKGVLCVDHDHETNKIRGLLCSRCNTGIGLFFDDVLILQNAINYLKQANQSGKA